MDGDAEQKNMVIKSNVTALKVEPEKKNNCVHIINEKGIRKIILRSGIIVPKAETRAENFSPIEILA